MPTISQQYKKKLSIKFFLLTASFSAVFIVLSIGVQLSFEYKKELSLIEQNVKFIEKSYVPSITDSLFKMDEPHMRILMEGVLQLRGIEYCEVSYYSGNTTDNIIATGTKNGEGNFSREFELNYQNSTGKQISLGKMTVLANFNTISTWLWHRASMQIALSALAICFTAFIMLILFHQLVARHLSTMAEYAQGLNINNLKQVLQLKRKYNGDELDLVTEAINSLCYRLQQEITELKQADTALKDSEKRYRLIAENVADIIWTMDIDFNFTYISPSIFQQRGYTVEEGMKQSLADVLTPDSLKKTMDLFIEKLTLSESDAGELFSPVEFEVQQSCKDGSLIWTSNNARILSDSNKQPISILGVTRNITDRVLAEKKVKEKEKKYRNLFESSMDAIMLLDLEKGYLDCNPAALEMFSIESKEELVKLTPVDLSPQYQPDGILSSEKAAQMMAKALETGSNLFEWTHKCHNGEEFYASVLITRLEIDGETILQGAIRDISDYKRTQEIMIQTEKMLSVGGLAAGMAHEINNPLAGIMQTTDVMRNRLTNIEMPANIKAAKEVGISIDDIKTFMEKRDISRMLTNIHESGRRVAKIVTNMLSFARKSEGRISSHSLEELINKTMELAATDYNLKKQYDFKKFKIIMEHEDNLPPVPCESGKIQQVLLNILSNGAQAMTEAGIKEPQFIIRTQFKKEHNTICIEIEDNGPGIDKAIQKRIFEPFFTTKPVGTGTGLGLSVSYFIITENHGGEMTVESTPGSGAKFIIHLPCEENNK